MNKEIITHSAVLTLGFSIVLIANCFSVKAQTAAENFDSAQKIAVEKLQTAVQSAETKDDILKNEKSVNEIDKMPDKPAEETKSGFSPKVKNPFEDFEKNNPELFPVKTDDDDKKKKKAKRIDTEEKKWEISPDSIEYGIEGGFAPNIATWMSGPKPWDISGHKHLLGSFRWGKILGTRGIVTFSYAIEFTPLSVAIGNQTENIERRTNPLAPATKRTNNFGAAINPTSFRFIFFPQYRLRPFIFSGLGISYHLKPVPIESGTKWNLAWDFGFGGQYMLSKTKAIQFGYRYYHLSNVYLSNYNPGYNSNIYFVGYSIFKK